MTPVGPTDPGEIPPLPSLWADLARFDWSGGHDGGGGVNPVEYVSFHRNIWHIPEQMSDEEMQAELARLYEAEDRQRHAEGILRQARAVEQDRCRDEADARFAEARRLHPHATLEQVAAMLDPEPGQYVNAVQINAIET